MDREFVIWRRRARWRDMVLGCRWLFRFLGWRDMALGGCFAMVLCGVIWCSVPFTILESYTYTYTTYHFLFCEFDL
nr:hypothetical protein CFP56_35907 [Quercus suber]POF06042.1 hypothetical protein CFP56_41930 [Quercus suber]